MGTPATTCTAPDRTFACYQHLGEHDFPLEMLLAAELAQFNTYAIPSISAILHRTGHYEREGLKRLDDTRATLTDILNFPPGHPTRTVMLEHLHWVHSHYRISNDDYLYTLLMLFLKPMEWVQKWGWRQLSAAEIDGLVEAMLALGRDMGIRIEDPSLAGLQAWQQHYYRHQARFDPANQAVAEGTLRGLADHFPRWGRGWVPGLVAALLDDPVLLGHLGMAPASRAQRWLVRGTLRGWQWLSRFYRPWRQRRFSDSWLANYYPSYPGGKLDYQQLGPSKLVNRRNRQGSCPFSRS